MYVRLHVCLHTYPYNGIYMCIHSCFLDAPGPPLVFGLHSNAFFRENLAKTKQNCKFRVLRDQGHGGYKGPPYIYIYICLRILTTKPLRLHAPPHPEDSQGKKGHAADEPENPHNEALEAACTSSPWGSSGERGACSRWAWESSQQSLWGWEAWSKGVQGFPILVPRQKSPPQKK